MDNAHDRASTYVLNLAILMKTILHNYPSAGDRPLFLYLSRDKEERFINKIINGKRKQMIFKSFYS